MSDQPQDSYKLSDDAVSVRRIPVDMSSWDAEKMINEDIANANCSGYTLYELTSSVHSNGDLTVFLRYRNDPVD